jgi:hypothetical protein
MARQSTIDDLSIDLPVCRGTQRRRQQRPVGPLIGC